MTSSKESRTILGVGGEEARAIRERDAWMETAAFHARNEEFYRGIVRKIGEMFGEAARTSDDGSIQQDVLALRVPELVAAIIKAQGNDEPCDEPCEICGTPTARMKPRHCDQCVAEGR